MAKKNEVQKSSLLAKYREKAESQATGSGGLNLPPYLRVAEVTASRGRQESRMVIVDPGQKDDKGKNLEVQSEAIKAVILHEIPFAEFRYRDASGKWHTEAFSLGTKKQAYSIGRLHEKFGYALPRTRVDELIGRPGGIDVKRHVTTFEGNQKLDDVRYGSRHLMVLLLHKQHWFNEDEPLIVTMFPPMSSVYGTSLDDELTAEERAELRGLTLKAFPVRGEGESKGALLTLQSRPWELAGGAEAGADKTPMEAVWVTIAGTWLGTTVAVPAFEIGWEGEDGERQVELTLEELELVDSVQAQARELVLDWAARGYTEALPMLDHGRARALAAAALDGDFEGLRQQAVTALPEVVAEDDADGDDFEEEPVRTARPARAARAVQRAEVVEDEFPDDENLPF